MAKNYNTRTASLKATIADIRNLDAKQIKLNGNPIVGNVYDLREGNISEYDIWPNGVQTDENGNVTVYPLGYNKISLDDLTDEQYEKVCSSAKIIDNVCYDENDNIICYFETSALESLGSERASIFKNTNMIFSSDLSSLKDGGYFFVDWCTGVEDTSDLQDLNLDLKSLEVADGMFNNVHLNSLKLNMESAKFGITLLRNASIEKNIEINAPLLSNLSIDFIDCDTFSGKFDSIVENMGIVGSKIKNFDAEFSSLKSASQSFSQCEIENFNAIMPNLESANQMFPDSFITNFNSNLDKLEDGRYMFILQNNINFNSNLPSLKYGSYMFQECSLTTFNSELSSLIDGAQMFSYCFLNSKSLNNIIHTINDLTQIELPSSEEPLGVITLGVGIEDSDETRQLMAEECCCDSWEKLEEEFTKKGWTTEFQFNGPITYGLRNTSESSDIWAKLVEETSERKQKFAKYTSQDGTKFYNIHWYHRSNGSNEGYTQFASLAEAIENFNVIEKQ